MTALNAEWQLKCLISSPLGTEYQGQLKKK